MVLYVVQALEHWFSNRPEVYADLHRAAIYGDLLHYRHPHGISSLP